MRRGLTDLIGGEAEGDRREIPLAQIESNPRQPRKSFDEDSLRELAESIREYGVMQPIRVRPIGHERYEIVMGERRVRAAKLAGLNTIPAFVGESDDRRTLEMAIVENVQREDVPPLEAAAAYRRLADEFGLPQDEIARKTGKARATIANTMRLLKLDPEVAALLRDGELSEGHARALLGTADLGRQAELGRRAVAEGWNVRRTEREVDATPRKAKTKRSSGPDQLSQALSEHLGVVAQVEKGRIVIRYSSEEELERLFELFGVQL